MGSVDYSRVPDMILRMDCCLYEVSDVLLMFVWVFSEFYGLLLLLKIMQVCCVLVCRYVNECVNGLGIQGVFPLHIQCSQDSRQKPFNI